MTSPHYISKGNGTPLVFQHGLTANVKQVDAFLDGLEGVQLLSIDCPGHGKSPLPSGYLCSFDRYAREVIHFMDRMAIEKAILGGISMGSGISLNIALRYPGRVKGLILVRPAWLDRSDPENLHILLLASRLMNQPQGKEIFRQLPEFKQIDLEAVAQSVMSIFADDQQPSLEIVIDRMVGDRPFTSMHQLGKIKVPCLVLGNDDDPLHPFEMAEKIHQQIAGSVLEKLTSRYIDNDLHTSQARTSIQKFLKQNHPY